MQISKRLEAVADMVTSGCRLVDVGTDHGYIPIFLTEAGRIPGAIAGDVNRGPLQKAVEHIREYGLEDRIETRLSDGLLAMQPGEADSIIIAGMGGPLTVRILKEGKTVADAVKELILQPQSDIKQVRKYLEDEGWQIVREEMVMEEGKYYPMMRAVQTDSYQTEPSGTEKTAESERLEMECAAAKETSRKMSDAQLRYGPLLIERRHPVLKEFLLRERSLNERILEALDGQSKEGSLERRREVMQELAIIEEVLAVYDPAKV